MSMEDMLGSLALLPGPFSSWNPIPFPVSWHPSKIGMHPKELTFPLSVLGVHIAFEQRLVFFLYRMLCKELSEGGREAMDCVGAPAVWGVLHNSVENISAPVAGRQRLGSYKSSADLILKYGK